MKYHNPVIPGFYPDPSICRVEDTFYLVTSSFQFFPGVPLFESKDLVNWKQIGHVLTRQSQLPLAKANACGGIYAPTIRYDAGRFYMVTTNVSEGGNFYVYTDDIHGEWSDPIYVQQDGIDPSLYFENGRAYFMSNGTDDEGVNGVVMSEIAITTGTKLSPTKCLWKGTGGRFLESPHLYRIAGRYHLMASEGGTEYGHMVVAAHSESLWGEYHTAQNNPVLTNRNLGGYVLQGCGHGDLVEDTKGNWWMVHLGFRQIDPWVMHHITGREVNLVPVDFDIKGEIHAGCDGTTLLEMETDRMENTIVQAPLREISFANTRLSHEWCYLRNPIVGNYIFEDEVLFLRGNELSMSTHEGSPSFVGIRQQEMCMHAECTIEISEGEAGITLYMSPDQHYEIAIMKQETSYILLRRLCIGDITQEAPKISIAGGNAKLIVVADHFHYHFKAVIQDREYDLGTAQTKYLSTEVAGNFTGVMIGLYARNTAETFAKFHKFLCKYEKK